MACINFYSLKFSRVLPMVWVVSLTPQRLAWISDRSFCASEWPLVSINYKIDPQSHGELLPPCRAVILDLDASEWRTAEVLERVQRDAPGVPILIHDPAASPADAVRLARLGAYQFLPVDEKAVALLDGQLARLALVMMKVDVFAFGGGFASVPLMFREVVDLRRWVPASVFMDGVALGQATPGPIVITATFVGHQVAGLAGAMIGTVCVFLPSLFAVVLVEPWFGRLASSSLFRGAIQGFVLSFVGLLASVTLQFARLTPWNGPSVIIAILALGALLYKIDVLWVVLAGAVMSAMIM